jgi:Tfp pilus assembly protein PilX
MKRIHTSQSGMAAIIVTMILVVVIGLIVLGLSQVSDRNSREALDNVLSTQASYAAESGINDAIGAIKSGISIPSGTPNCTGFIQAMVSGDYMQTNGNMLSNSPKIGYTCLMVTGTPQNLTADVSQGQSTVLRINPTGDGTNTLTFSWGPSIPGSVSQCPTYNAVAEFVPNNLYTCPYAVIRADIYNDNPADFTGNSDTTAVNLANDTESFDFVPVSSGAFSNPVPLTFDASTDTENDHVQQIPVDCSSGNCVLTFKNTAGLLTDAYVRLTSVYSNRDIDPITITGDTGLGFQNSQVLIDSTGIDRDELQRIQVRVPIETPNGTAPSNAVSGGEELCKRFTTTGPGSSADYSWNYTNGTGILADNTSLCGAAYKPVIYLYPQFAEHVNVKLDYPSGFSQTIPSYDPTSGWNVIASPDGTLTNVKDGASYPYLYWEGNPLAFNLTTTQGFVVPGKDTASFLRKELPIIGLNKTETTAFIAYWAPRMQNNAYSYIHFAGSDYTSLAKLTITPKPNSLLRVFMEEKPISQPFTVTPQTFPTFTRTGFTAVEWGGTIL